MKIRSSKHDNRDNKNLLLYTKMFTRSKIFVLDRGSTTRYDILHVRVAFVRPRISYFTGIKRESKN